MFILKSRSPRRIEILRNLGLSFLVVPSDIDENQYLNEEPLSYLKRIVILKLGDLSNITSGSLLISCDTIVVYENQILHKPHSVEMALETLSLLNGKRHEVYSAACIFKNGNLDFFFETTTVQFKNLSRKQILDYIRKNKPFDKAGSYGIQDTDGPVLNFIGSYHNVMGFPLRSFIARHDQWISAWR